MVDFSDPRCQIEAYIVLEQDSIKTLYRVSRIEQCSVGKHKVESRIWLEDCYGFTNEESGEYEFRHRWISLKDVGEKCKLIKAAPSRKRSKRKLAAQAA